MDPLSERREDRGMVSDGSISESTFEDGKELKEVEVYQYDRRERKLDPGRNIVRKRKHWFQLWCVRCAYLVKVHLPC